MFSTQETYSPNTSAPSNTGVLSYSCSQWGRAAAVHSRLLGTSCSMGAAPRELRAPRRVGKSPAGNSSTAFCFQRLPAECQHLPQPEQIYMPAGSVTYGSQSPLWEGVIKKPLCKLCVHRLMQPKKVAVRFSSREKNNAQNHDSKSSWSPMCQEAVNYAVQDDSDLAPQRRHSNSCH